MAYTTINFYSKRLRREVTINALLPIDGADKPEFSSTSQKPLKSLYLLNGLTGSHTDWISYTRIRKLANQYNIAVFMPAGENHFYVDDADREAYYGKFIGEELVEFTRNMFPLSREREHTFIGGLSMGGYGAIRNGIKYTERFGAIIGLSSALLPYKIANATPDYNDGVFNYHYLTKVFGDLDKVLDTDMNPETLICQLKASAISMPKVYLSCGTEDFLLDVNRRFHQFLIDQNITHTYKEKPGGHTWDYWDAGIEDALKWLTEEGVL